jgi:hypothetical protein
VRAGKTRQKEATLDRRKARQREREYEALITGGSVTISKSGRKTILSREARDARADNIVRYNQNRLADSQPATINLPHIKHRLRSSCEEKVMEFGLDQLFPDLEMIYSETRPDRVSEIGCTWWGNLFPWERDIDVLVKDWQCDLFPDKGWDEFQLQTKGTGWDFQAAIIRHLFEMNYPIVSIVHNGGKSLYVWCAVRVGEEAILGSIRYAASLGVDDKGKVPVYADTESGSSDSQADSALSQPCAYQPLKIFSKISRNAHSMNLAAKSRDYASLQRTNTNQRCFHDAASFRTTRKANGETTRSAVEEPLP